MQGGYHNEGVRAVVIADGMRWSAKIRHIF